MKATCTLHELGQSLWLDNITRDLLDKGGLKKYIDEYSVTGLTSNPTIFDEAIGGGDAYDQGIREKAQAGKSGEELFTELALEDLRRAADLFKPVFESTHHVDGWVSMEVSPELASNTQGSIEAAKKIHKQADRPNLYVKIPGTPEGVPAIEEAIFAGVPINVTLLFSSEQYLAAAHAYMRGIARRIEAGLDPKISSVASIFVSRWDKKVADKVPDGLKNKLGIAMGGRAYKAYRDLLDSTQWRKLADAGALPQRLLWASTGTKDPKASDTLYIDALAAPDTVNTIPEKTLHAVFDHGHFDGPMATDAQQAEATLAQFAEAGIDTKEVAAQLQKEGAASFVKSWSQLMERIKEKSEQLDGRKAKSP